MKRYQIISAAVLTGMIVLSGCAKKDADFSESPGEPASTQQAQDNVPLPEETAEAGYTEVSKAVVWDQAADVETTLATEATTLAFSKVGTLQYSDLVKPEEGTELYGLAYTRTYNAGYLEQTTTPEQGEYTFIWNENMEGQPLNIPSAVDSGVIVISVPEGSTPEIHTEVPGMPNQVVELPSGERTTTDMGQAFYADHAGYTGEADNPDFDESESDYFLEGGIESIETDFFNRDGEVIKQGNNISINMEFAPYPKPFSSNDDFQLSNISQAYELKGATSGETYKGEVISEASSLVGFTVPEVEESYELTVNIKADKTDSITIEKTGQTWNESFTRIISF